MARSTLATLITRLRDLVFDAGTATWSDDQLQRFLDSRRRDFYRQILTPVPNYAAGGTAQWFEYRAPYGDCESTDGGTAVFLVEDGVGVDQGTAGWSADYQRGVITFTTDRYGTAYYLTYRAYDLYGAAADTLRTLSVQHALRFDFSTDGDSFSRNQVFQNLIRLVDVYEGQALGWLRGGDGSGVLVRSDVA